MDEELKPCPFCGSKNISISFSKDFPSYVCRDCYTNGPIAEQGESKVELWNTRPPNWQPIETAPRNGKIILVYYKNEQGKNRIVKARYVNKFTVECDDDMYQVDYDEDDVPFCPEGWYEQVDNYDDYAEFCIQRQSITHWMPLPEPPTKE